MTTTKFTDAVEIEGSQDTTQLKVQRHTSQTEPLQSWEDSSGNTLSRITADGRIQVGDDLGMETPDALIEAHRDLTSASAPRRGLHTLGRVVGVLGTAIQWTVHELELRGSGAFSGLHTALRARLTHDSTGDVSNAELRAGDFEVVNEPQAPASRVGRATAVHAAVTNRTTGYLDEAVGIEVAVNNENPDVTYAPINTAYGVRVNDVDQAASNYALHTGKGTVHLGDDVEVPVVDTPPVENPPPGFAKMFMKAEAGNYGLWAKDDTGAVQGLSGLESIGAAFPLSSSGGLNPILSLAGVIPNEYLPPLGKYPPGYITGLKISVDDNRELIHVSAGACASADNTVDLVSNSAQTISYLAGSATGWWMSLPPAAGWYPVVLWQHTSGVINFGVTVNSQPYAAPPEYEVRRVIGYVYYDNALPGLRKTVTLMQSPGIRITYYNDSQLNLRIGHNLHIPMTPSQVSVDMSPWIPPSARMMLTFWNAHTGDGGVDIHHRDLYQVASPPAGIATWLLIPRHPGENIYRLNKFGGTESITRLHWRIIAYLEDTEG